MATDKPSRFRCPKCAKPLNVPDRLTGKRGKCPACKTVIDFPAGPPAPTRAPPVQKAQPIHQLPGDPNRWQSVATGLRLIYIGHLIAAIGSLPVLFIAHMLSASQAPPDLVNPCTGLHLFILAIATIVAVVGDWMMTRVPPQTGLGKWAYASAISLTAGLSAAPILMILTAMIVELVIGRSAGQLPVQVFSWVFNLAVLVRCVTFVLFLRGLAIVMGNAEHLQNVTRFAKFWIGFLPGLFVFAFVFTALVRLIPYLFDVDPVAVMIAMGLIFVGGGVYLVVVLIRWLLRLISQTREMILIDLGIENSQEDQEEEE